MLDVLFHLPYSWLNIWTASADQIGVMYMDYVIGTFILCLWGYAILFLPSLFGIKSPLVTKAIKWLFVVNVLLAIAPVAVPVIVLYGLFRVMREAYGLVNAQGNPHPSRRPRPLPALVADEEEEDGHEH